MRAFKVVRRQTVVAQNTALIGYVQRRARLAFLPQETNSETQRVTRRLLTDNVPLPLSTDEEDAMLVRMLVQDAFHPISKQAPAAQRDEPHSVVNQRADVRTSRVDPAPAPSSGAETKAHTPSSPASKQQAEHENDTDTVELTGSSITTAPHTFSISTLSMAACGSGNGCAEEHSAVTDARSRHAAAEPFAVIRKVELTAPPDAEEARALEWMCLECKAFNSLSSSPDVCESCNASASLSHRSARPPVRHVALLPSTWVCTYCSHANATAREKRQPGAASPSPPSAAEQRQKFSCGHCGKPFTGVQMWTCPECTHVSPRAATQCPTCFAQRPVQWTCKGCQHDKNSVFCLDCSRCGGRRPSLHSNAVHSCAFCGDLNDVRWELCATCMAPCSEAADAAASSTHGTVVQEERNSAPDSWSSAADPLVRDARGFLHSKTATHASLLSSPTLEAYTQLTTAPVGKALHSSAAAVALHRKRSPTPLLDKAWWCSTCNVPQRRNVSYCDICLQARDSMLRRQREEQAELAKLRAKALSNCVGSDAVAAGASVVPATADGDWRCPYCCQLHGVEERRCCGHEREVPPGYWLCDQCCSTNLQARAACLGCGQSQQFVRAWTCPWCAHRNHSEATVCGQCGIAHELTVPATASEDVKDAAATAALASTSVVCPVCAAPNLAERLGCYRCRARLHDVEWTCHACGHGSRDRHAARCADCKALRTFDLSEEVWVCEVCSAGVHSGGELPVRTHCPLCRSLRAAAAPHFPARWRCSCGMYNRARVSVCPECNTRRRLPALHTVVSCPHCFRDTTLDVTETCAHCSEVLGGCFEVFENAITADTAMQGIDQARNDSVVEDAEDDDVVAELSGNEAP